MRDTDIIDALRTGRWDLISDVLAHAVLPATALGLLTAQQRRVTGGVLGPIVSHLTWSLGMLFLLPTALTLGG